MAGTETKAQRVERLKRELNPWEAYAEIQRFAREGWDAIPPEWLGTYFRWWGIYTQGDGIGAIGGKGGEGKATRHFMVRIRIPNGQLQAHQLRTIAGLAERYARGIADITVRQNIQLHWVTLESLPDVFQTLWRTGITTMGACGDVTRNVTGCPLAGVDADEIVDASPVVHAATRMVNGNPAFYNLPRKYKVSITGCRVWCSYPEVNDVGLTALHHPATGEIGFAVRVGGGLSTDPRLATRLDAFVRWHEALPVLRAISEIFRDSDVLRQSREKARLKFLFLQHGWTAEKFLAAIEDRLGRALEHGVPDDPPEDVHRDRAGALAHALEAAGLRLDASPFWRGTIACTGSEFCKLALTETKGFALALVEELETRLPGFDEHVKVHVTGCPNSCGQHWIADLGIEGKEVKVDGALVDAYYFCVGGALGRHSATARPIGLRVPAADVGAAIERLLRAFLAERLAGENFREFCARHTDEELRALLAGELVDAVERDVPAGQLPHGVDG